MIVVTIAARNYLAQVRTLAASVREHEPNATFRALIVDAAPGQTFEAVETIPMADLGIPLRELHLMAAIYDVVEFATSLKPWLLEAMLDRGGGPVVYLDPDTRVYADFQAALPDSGPATVLLTPHVLGSPEPGGFSEAELLGYGSFNLGFIAVDHAARPFLRWWQRHLRRDCIRDIPSNRFVDQRWLDLSPALFDAQPVTDPGFNVAYWNLASRTLSGSMTDGWEVDGHPLRFFHFSNFDESTPDILTRNPIVSAWPQFFRTSAVRELCVSYAGSLLTNGIADWRMVEYGFGRSADGALITRALRRQFRVDLGRADAGGLPMPDPFDGADTGAFLRWRRCALIRGGARRVRRAFHRGRRALQQGGT